MHKSKGSSKPSTSAAAAADPDMVLSKRLSYYLRHGAEKAGLSVRPDGYVPTAELLSLKDMQKYNIHDIQRVVDANDKKRFTITNEDGVLLIKANQGHTIAVDDLELVPITDASQVPCVIHGTYMRYIQSILATGLDRMDRNHIHFSQGKFGEVKSGYRGNCEVLIYIDLEQALADGIPFMIAPNDVVLSEGIDGVIPPKYFKKVVRADGTPIMKLSDSKKAAASMFHTHG